MAYIANTAFEERVVNKGDWTLRVPGKFNISSPAVCSAGFIVTKNGLLNNEGYGTAIKNLNSWDMVASTAGAEDELYICNPYNVATLTDIDGNDYRVGYGTLGLPLPAGEMGTFTKVEKEAIYSFGAGNFSAAPTATNKYCAVANGLMVPDDEAPATGWYFELIEIGNFAKGRYLGGAKYTVVAKKA